MSGIPKVENMLSIIVMTVLDAVDLITSTIGNLVYSSITTNRYSPLVIVPKKSHLTFSHGLLGNGYIFRGSNLF